MDPARRSVDFDTSPAFRLLRSRNAGADDRAIHDTVLIAAMFCMFNRYVDGLATWAPREPRVHEEIGARIAAEGCGSRFRETP